MSLNIRMLTSIIILLMIASVSIAVSVNESSVNESSVNESSVNESNITIESASISTKDMPTEGQIYVTEKPDPKTIKERFLNRTKNRENFNVTGLAFNATSISVVVPTDISYTNPITGVSTFGTPISMDIYTNDVVSLANIDFYLPTSSYVYVDFSSTYYMLGEWSAYNMYVDNSQVAYGVNYYLCNTYCGTDFGKSTTIYLTKGWHYVSVDGNVNRYSDLYQVRGYLSILAFPEYTAITVNSPNGGENWAKGTTKTISWASFGNPGANVKIELYKAGIRSAVISSKTSNDGSYIWYIPSYQPIGADYNIKITSYENPVYYDWGNSKFRIY